MRWLLAILTRIKDAYDWTQFFEVLRQSLDKLGISAVSGLIGALTGAWAGATWYEILLVSLLCFVAAHVYLVLKALRKKKPDIEIIFDPTDTRYVRPIMSLYGQSGEYFAIAIRNPGSKTLYEVRVRARDSWIVREWIAIATKGQRSHPGSDVPLLLLEILHPNAPEFIQLGGLSYQSSVSHQDYIFNTVQRFTIEASARDSAPALSTFEFDPKTRPMVNRVNHS